MISQILYFCKFFLFESYKFVLIKKIGNNIFEENKLKKILITVFFVLCVASNSAFADKYTNYSSQPNQYVQYSNTKSIQNNTQQRQYNTINNKTAPAVNRGYQYSNPTTTKQINSVQNVQNKTNVQNGNPNRLPVKQQPQQKQSQQKQQQQKQQQQIQQKTPVKNEEKTIFESNVDKSVITKFAFTKELKKEYKDISKNEKIVEACEMLKYGAGNFSYKSIHGNNKTNSPIEITFANLEKDKEHSDSDAFGEFSGKKYKIIINSKFADSPAAALAPVIAREALVSKNKDENDLEMAEQLQIAVWTQILKKQPYMENSEDKLVQMQNKLKQSGNLEEYTAFFSETKNTKKASPEKKDASKKPEKSKERGNAAQEAFDFDKQAEGEKIEAEILSYDSKALEKKYKKVTKETRIIEALEFLKDSVGKFSHDAILGKNLTHRPISIKFKDLSQINPKYSTFDALGWRQAGKLNIFINSKHSDAPAAAIAAILSHEALHQDEFDSLNEETYAWTMEASVWAQMCDKYPEVGDIAHPLVTRENLLKKLLEKGNYTSKYIKKSVFSNPSYSNLPVRSPGFETDF